MKKIIHFILLAGILSSCGSSKNYLERSNEDKALLDAVRKLNKSATDENALAAVPILYSNIQKTHIAKVKSFAASKDINRWDNIIGEYNDLQEAYNAIINSSAAFRLVNPQNFGTELLEAKQAAAEEYYQAAEAVNDHGGRDNARKAYTYYQKADRYIAGFRDAREKMDQAYENSIVNVIINPVEDNSYFNTGGWGNIGSNYSNQYFQETLLRDLQNQNNGGLYAARYYNEWQARSQAVQPDWIVDLRLRDMDVPYPSTSNSSRNSSAQVKIGTDTAGRPVYKTVYATLNVVRSSFVARATMDVSITDLKTGRTISNQSFRDDYRWQEDRATYSGDSRALSQSDWAMINNSYNPPTKENILNELYREIYPRVKSSISNATRW